MSEVNSFLDFAIREFSKEFIRNRATDIRRADVVNTEELLNSLYARVNSQPERIIFFMTVFLKTRGRYPEIRRRYTKAGGEEMIQELEEWATTEGIEKFRRGRYGRKYADMSDAEVASAVAWGIVKRMKRTGTARRKSWWNKGKTRDIENFYDYILRGFAEATLADAKTNIENGNTP